MRPLSLPAEGVRIDIPVASSWGSGVYALVSAYRPSDMPGPQQSGPGRAVGVAWLAIDSSPRTLTAALFGPSVGPPRTPGAIPVKAGGLAPAGGAYGTPPPV